MKIALFITCFNDTIFPNTGKAVVEILERLGHEVVFPEAQTCCGQMHFNTGYQSEAMPLIRQFVQTFSAYDVVVSPSASCTGMVRDMYRLAAEVHHDIGLADAVNQLARNVYEFSELLVNRLQVTDVGAYYPHRVTYHPTCHSLRGIRVGDAPEQLLRAVRGIDYVPLNSGSECCGFGGTFAIKNADTSMAMLGDKVRHILDTRAEVCVAADNSCLMHIGGALHRQRSGVRVAHLAEILVAQE
ncbi:MAG: (Fe-S)-binding protein [Roseiflexaceae bacterium]|jgi:L-lactate dehydrogenase complex protein LldE|nr:(Fe-S)-binding protein [Chloroflexaceae bacterium]MCE2851197.1 (Fe-S)-binding protein [Chloroflexaceae bacterium]